MTPVSCPVRDNNAYHRYRSATCRRYVASRPTRNGSANGRWTRTCGTSANRRVNAIAPSRPALTAMLDSVRSPRSVVARAGMKFEIPSVVLIPPIPTRKPKRRRRIGSGCQPNRADTVVLRTAVRVVTGPDTIVSVPGSRQWNEGRSHCRRCRPGTSSSSRMLVRGERKAPTPRPTPVVRVVVAESHGPNQTQGRPQRRTHLTSGARAIAQRRAQRRPG